MITRKFTKFVGPDVDEEAALHVVAWNGLTHSILRGNGDFGILDEVEIEITVRKKGDSEEQRSNDFAKNTAAEEMIKERQEELNKQIREVSDILSMSASVGESTSRSEDDLSRYEYEADRDFERFRERQTGAEPSGEAAHPGPAPGFFASPQKVEEWMERVEKYILHGQAKTESCTEDPKASHNDYLYLLEKIENLNSISRDEFREFRHPVESENLYLKMNSASRDELSKFKHDTEMQIERMKHVISTLEDKVNGSSKVVHPEADVLEKVRPPRWKRTYCVGDALCDKDGEVYHLDESWQLVRADADIKKVEFSFWESMEKLAKRNAKFVGCKAKMLELVKYGRDDSYIAGVKHAIILFEEEYGDGKE